MSVQVTVSAIYLEQKTFFLHSLQKSQFCLLLSPKPSVWYQRRCNITNNTKIIPVIKVQIYINWSFVCCSSRNGDVLCKFLVHITLTWQCWFSGPRNCPTGTERRCQGRRPAACTVRSPACRYGRGAHS